MSDNRDGKTIGGDGGRSDSSSEGGSLKRELLAELRASWEAKRPVPPEDLLKRWPGEVAEDPDAASLLLEDYLRRTRRCPEPADGPDGDQFPQLQDSLKGVSFRPGVSQHPGTLPSADLRPRLPELDDSLFGFTLRRELGRGAFARVFLAEEGDLASRPVVVKISRIEGTEPQTLAQLQHAHIVPVYSVHEDARAGLRALCMPYFGGASLSQVLDAIRETTAFPTQGAELVRALDALGSPLPRTQDGQGDGIGQGDKGTRGQGDKDIGARSNSSLPLSPCPLVPLSPCPTKSPDAPRVTLGRLSYIRASAWVVSRLAEGLQHAHQLGVLHRDIKPSNILLAADGQPMLLDFNLAQSEADGQAQVSLGGTVAYMAPEHLRAMTGRDPSLAHAVDQRSDIYALGMVLYEMLSGRRPFDQHASYAPLPVLIEAMALERGRASPSLRALRPDAPWSLESILHRCLDPNPDCRYRQAEELAEDLRRFIEDRPLRYAPELSRVERVRKWVRRHPRLTSAGTVCAAALLLLAGAGIALAGVRDSLAETQGRLEVAHSQDRKREFEKGTEQALFLVNTTHDMEDHAREGPTVCATTLQLYEVLERSDWEEHPDWRRLAEEDRHRLAGDVRELLLLLAGARVQLAPHDRPTLTAALELLDRAEAIRGLEPCRALWEDREAYLRKLGDGAAADRARDEAKGIKPHTARDFYLLAMTCAREWKYGDAITHLDEALRLNPRHYWAWVQRGLCHNARNDPVLAAADFGVCVGLKPDFAWGYFNRAYSLARCGRRAEALDDYTSALRCDRGLHAAYLNRGLLRLEEGDPSAALTDFDQALARGRDDAALHSGRGVALERLDRYAEADMAFATARSRAADGPRDVRRRLHWVYGFAVAARLPKEAQEAFLGVLAEEPNHPQALYGCAMLLERKEKWAEALTYYDRALAAAPDFTEARRFRAVLLARTGDFRKAAEDIQKCLNQEPSSGATRYAAACVAALSVRADSREAARAVLFLRQAFELGYGRDKAAGDPDLEAVRDHPDFPK